MKHVTKNFMMFMLMLSMVFSSIPLNALAADAQTNNLTVICTSENQIDGTLIGKQGDTFQFKAVNENEEEVAVTWSTASSWIGTVDEETGLFTVTSSLGSGGSSFLYVTATSKDNTEVKKEQSFTLTGYQLSSYQKEQTVNLSEDGQSVKTVSISGGYSGHTVWDYKDAVDSGLLQLKADPEKKSSVSFNALRPGTVTVSYKLDFNEDMNDSAVITVNGVAVEDPQGNHGKTYLDITANQASPTVQLAAFAAQDKTISSWESSDENVATVDENGLVTGKAAGSALITATDSDGKKGGIKAVVANEAFPCFESLEFMTSAFASGAWTAGKTYEPTKTEYDLPIRAYSTSQLTLQATTLYDTDKYDAAAEYVDANGKAQNIAVNSGKITYLKEIPFEKSVVTITITDKKKPELKTAYMFYVDRPRDTTKAIKSNGIVLNPAGRRLLATKYNGQAEGTMFKADENGMLTSGNGVTQAQHDYRTYLLEGLKDFTLTCSGSTAYQHLRYTADGGQTWTELAQGSGDTKQISIPGDSGAVKVQLQILDDAAYSANVKAGKDGFAEGESVTYNIWVESVSAGTASAQILTAETESGDWYAPFSPDISSYTIVVPNNTADMPMLKYTAAEGAVVKLGSAQQTPDDEGVYSLELKTSAQTVNINSADGLVSNSYSFRVLKKSKFDVPDKVTDYICINSQYTNGGFGGVGVAPEKTLSGSMVSLGNFGGYITYYYEDPLTDHPNHKYGVDFYVYGNANIDSSTSTGTSFFEPGQVWVSEDGKTWYALAGSAHYDEGVDWNYQVTYTKAANGKTAWTDSQGNSNSGSSYTGVWPIAANYYMNPASAGDSISLSGIMLPAANGSSAVSGEAVDAYPVNWGYADVFSNGTIGEEIDPYLDNTNHKHKANGFDLAWAVDAAGVPVDVSGKGFHYVKVQTASNIWHTSFGEKSTEVAQIVRTSAQESAVGRTAALTGVTVSDGADSKVVNFNSDTQIYSLDVGDMKYVSVAVNGAGADDNIYVNNKRIAAKEAVDGIKITKEGGEKLVRILVQNGDKEPVIYLLKLTGSAAESDEMIENIKVNVAGVTRLASTKDGVEYNLSVGYRIDKINIVPVLKPDVEYTVDGKAPADAYELNDGVNAFEITAAAAGGSTQTVKLNVTREKAPESSGKNISVKFTLLGDDKHGTPDEGNIHTLKAGNLQTWIKSTSYTVPAEYTVLDVLETALKESGLQFVNADGNYISEIDGLKEFSNGPLSGWMYTLNGRHSDKGVAEQTLKNGDKIVFHYTDDYTKEQGSENWSGGSGSGSAVTPEGLPGEDASLPGKLPFTDVAATAWYHDAVQYVYEKKLFSGTAAAVFSPENEMDRAMVVTVLYNMAGRPEVSGGSGFADVKSSDYYADAVAWASKNEIVSGYSSGRFGGEDVITREQLAVILYHYAELMKYDTAAANELSGYRDASEISSWALSAMKWANAKGLITGRTASTLAPSGTATRAETAAVLMNFAKNVGK